MGLLRGLGPNVTLLMPLDQVIDAQAVGGWLEGVCGTVLPGGGWVGTWYRQGQSTDEMLG